MILDEQEVQDRFESPLNLLNRLKAPLVNRNNRSDIISIPPKSDDLIDNLEEKLRHGGLKSKASVIMNACLDELSLRIPEIEKPEKLAAIAAEMNKVVTAQAAEKEKADRPQIVIYAPSFVNEETFETIYVRE